MTRLITLNLRHGGGTRAAAICDYLVASQADILVLSEFRANPTGVMIQHRLAGAGYKHWSTSAPSGSTNGVAVAAKLPFSTEPHPTPALPARKARWLECAFAEFSVVAAYFPGMKPKLEYWKWFMPLARARAGKPCVIAGDFNTGKHRIDELGATFFGANYMAEMELGGWTDAWRHLFPEGREYTWSSNKGGEFRLDYVWLSRASSAWLCRAWHDHKPRTSKITDHSALFVELQISSL